MTEHIKKRIEQIRRGDMPAGYKKTKVGIIPIEWNVFPVGKCVIDYKVLSNDIKNIPVYSSSRKGLVPQTEYYDQKEATETNLGYKVVPRGYVTYRHMSDDDVFHFNINNTGNDILVSSEYPVFTVSPMAELAFLIPILNETSRFRYFCRMQKLGGTRTRLYFKNLGNYLVGMPQLPEQQKIAKILTTQDKLIELQQRKMEELKKLKKVYLQKMFPQKGKDVPEVRFTGFTDAWEQRKLGNVLVSLQNNTLSRADLSFEHGTALNVHYGDVLIKFGEYLDIRRETLPMILDDTIMAKYKDSFLQNGDVIVADTAEDETVGKCSEIAGLADEIVLSGLHTIPYRPLIKFATGYLGYYLNSNSYHHQLLPLMQGIKVTSISKSAMLNTTVCYPKSGEEQADISAYFRNLDNLITLHQRELEKLKKVKTAMLEKMFV